jgi:hypothetical protein
VLFDEEDDGEDETVHDVHAESTGQSSGEVEPPHLEETQLQEGVKRVTIATLLGVPRYYTFIIRGIL